MRRALIALLLAVCVLLAGCASSGGTATESCPPPKNFSEKPLPEKPTTLTNETAVEFAVAYENATTWNENLDGQKTDLNVGASGEVLNRTETGYLVHVSGGFSTYSCSMGQTAVGDGFVSANYFVNNSTVLRLEYPENRTVDPRDGGVVVEQWEANSSSASSY